MTKPKLTLAGAITAAMLTSSAFAASFDRNETSFSPTAPPPPAPEVSVTTPRNRPRMETNSAGVEGGLIGPPLGTGVAMSA